MKYYQSSMLMQIYGYYRSQIQLHSATGQTLCLPNHSLAWCAWKPWLQLMQKTINRRIISPSESLPCSVPVSAATHALDIGSGDPSQSVQTPHRGICRPQRGQIVPDMAAVPSGFPGVGWTTSPPADGGSWEEASCCVSGRVQ